MNNTKHDTANSAIYHIESMERKLRLLKQYINPELGLINDRQVALGLMVKIEDDVSDLLDDIANLN